MSITCYGEIVEAFCLSRERLIFLVKVLTKMLWWMHHPDLHFGLPGSFLIMLVLYFPVSYFSSFNVSGKWCGILWADSHVSCSFFPIIRALRYCLLFASFHTVSIYFSVTWFSCYSMFTAVNIKGVFNTSNETKYEKDAPDGMQD